MDSPLDLATSRRKTRKSNVALLLQPTLHNFGAPAPINPLDRITYRPNRQKSRKRAVRVLSGAKDLSYALSRNFNATLLLPHVFAVSPLLRYSYEKMRGAEARDQIF